MTVFQVRRQEGTWQDVIGTFNSLPIAREVMGALALETYRAVPKASLNFYGSDDREVVIHGRRENRYINYFVKVIE